MDQLQPYLPYILNGVGGAILAPFLCGILGGKGLGFAGNVIIGAAAGVGVGWAIGQFLPSAAHLLAAEGAEGPMTYVQDLAEGAAGGGVLGVLLGLFIRK